MLNGLDNSLSRLNPLGCLLNILFHGKQWLHQVDVIISPYTDFKLDDRE